MFENVIAQDCQAMYASEKRTVIIAAGKVVGFEKETQNLADKLPEWKKKVMNRFMDKK